MTLAIAVWRAKWSDGSGLNLAIAHPPLHDDDYEHMGVTKVRLSTHRVWGQIEEGATAGLLHHVIRVQYFVNIIWITKPSGGYCGIRFRDQLFMTVHVLKHLRTVHRRKPRWGNHCKSRVSDIALFDPIRPHEKYRVRPQARSPR
jgi:hypothetical protein